jgi:predicted amidohydrolase YtcJ
MELLLHGGRVLTMDPAVRGDAVLVRDSRIAAVGGLTELRPAAPSALSIDLRGCLLLPGLTDTHTHFYELARRRAGVDLGGACNLPAIRALLLAYRERMPAQQTWVGGGGWDPALLAGPRRPDRRLLDEVFPDHPVALESRDFHTMWCNTRALEAAGVLSEAAVPPGGEIGHRPDGAPDGLLYETAWELIWSARPPEPPEVADRWVHDAIAYAHGLGLTGFHSMEVDAALRTYERLRDRGELRMRVCFHTPLSDLGPRIERGEASYAGDDPWIRLGGVKVFMDGSLGSRSAWMQDTYPDGSRGRLLRTEEELTGILASAGRARIAGTVHAIGDATVALVCRAVAAARRLHGRTDLLDRIEHAQCVRPAQQQEIARLGIYCAMQPVHLSDDIPLLPAWGEAARFAYPFRSLLQAGVQIGLGSDAPVASLDPCAGVHCAIQRRAGRDPAAAPWHPQEALTATEAMLGYTLWAACGSRRERELGSITPGKLADLTALDDPGIEDPEAWRSVRTRLTVVGGEVVCERPS